MTLASLALVPPVVIPLLTAASCVLVGRRPAGQRVVGVTGAAVHTAAAAWLVMLVDRQDFAVTMLGGWTAPFGIALVADRLGAAMTLMAAVVGLLGAVFAIPDLDGLGREPHFMALLHLLLAGCSGLFLTGDLFNFYVWFELLLVASFGLMALGNRRAQLEATAKYLAINVIGSMLLLSAVGLLYALTGTLNMADLAQRLDALHRPELVTAIGMVVLVALAIKSAAFPFFFWLPASYHAPPVTVTAIFGGLMTKVGVYGLIRVFTLLFVQETGTTHTVILLLGAGTMVTGVLGAVAQHDMRRLLSFHIISQIGYMLMGLGLFTAAGLSAAFFFVLHIIVTKTALFFVSGAVERATGSFELDRAGGLYGSRPALAALFIVPALSLAGIPPLSGFVAKLHVVQAGLAARQPAIVAVALGVGALTLYSMAKIWTRAFLAPAAAGATPVRPVPRLLVVPALALVALTILMGVGARPLIAYTDAAARSLMDRGAYVAAVLGEDGR